MRTTLPAVLLLAAVVSAGAQDNARAFRTSLSLSGALTAGNSETLQVNAALETAGEIARLGRVRAGIDGNYAEADTDDGRQTTVENLRAVANAQKTLHERLFASLDLGASTDRIALVDYRVRVSPGLGVPILRSERTTLDAEAGPAYLWESVDDVRDDYLALRLAARLDHAHSETAKSWIALEYLPRTTDFADYLLNAELGVEAALNARLNLRLALQNRYDSRPAPELRENDVALLAGLGVTF